MKTRPNRVTSDPSRLLKQIEKIFDKKTDPPEYIALYHTAITTFLSSASNHNSMQWTNQLRNAFLAAKLAITRCSNQQVKDLAQTLLDAVERLPDKSLLKFYAKLSPYSL